MESFGAFLVGLFLGFIVVAIAAAVGRRRYRCLGDHLRRHFGQGKADQIEIQSREFPYRASVDAYQALFTWMEENAKVAAVHGVPITNDFMSDVGMAALLSPGCNGYFPTAIEYATFDVGADQPIASARHALWQVSKGSQKLAILWTTKTVHGGCGFQTKLRIDVAQLKGDANVSAEIFKVVERSIQQATSYRGKILSLEASSDYRGHSGGILVHRLRKVDREDVILPETTLRLLERNVVRFIQQREQLSQLGMPTKKGILLYGPPGTGKTHTIHHLIDALPGHTTLLVTAEQVGMLEEYLTLARLLQPSIVVMEDVDLIGGERDGMNANRESLLNRLLNEMDGLRADAEILFLLTTNRPESLEKALAARPGRVDQAIEFPLPDEAGRRKLIRLYSAGAKISDDVIAQTARITHGVSASFIKELMRRAIQFHLECRTNGDAIHILQNDVDQAIDELLFVGGSLNRTLLGADAAENSD